MTLAGQVTQFLDCHPEESFSAFTVAAHIGANRDSVATAMARMANERKLRKEGRGFYRSIKSPAVMPGLLMTGELHP